MTRNVRRRLFRESVVYTLIVLEVASGIFGGILLLGVIPGDSLNFNVPVSLAMAALAAAVFFFAGRYRKQLNA